MTTKKQIHIGIFPVDVGHHVGAWRHPDVPAGGGSDIRFYQDLARTAERGKLDMLFLGDQMTAHYPEDERFGLTSRMTRLEPTTLLAALSGVTTQLGLVGTASMSYFEPFHLARKFASLDLITGGRAGWNMVTSFDDMEARNFNLGQVAAPALRYHRAHEFVDVVRRLWDTWDEDAFVRDKASGQFFDPAKLHLADFSGEYFSSRGPLGIPRSPQSHPVLVQAGSSEDGRAFAAAHAEVIFTAHPALSEARRFYAELRDRVSRAGRNPDHVKILPGSMTFIGRTREEAQEKFDLLQSLIDPKLGWMVIKKHLGVDISGLPLDEPMPAFQASNTGQVSRQQVLIDAAARDKLTVRQFYERFVGSKGHQLAIGTASQVADEYEAWIDEGGADGFNLMLPSLPNALNDFVDLVVPELQRRGRFRIDYTGRTLRDNLGLPVPAHAHPESAAARRRS